MVDMKSFYERAQSALGLQKGMRQKRKETFGAKPGPAKRQRTPPQSPVNKPNDTDEKLEEAPMATPSGPAPRAESPSESKLPWGRTPATVPLAPAFENAPLAPASKLTAGGSDPEDNTHKLQELKVCLEEAKAESAKSARKVLELVKKQEDSAQRVLELIKQQEDTAERARELVNKKEKLERENKELKLKVDEVEQKFMAFVTELECEQEKSRLQLSVDESRLASLSDELIRARRSLAKNKLSVEATRDAEKLKKLLVATQKANEDLKLEKGRLTDRNKLLERMVNCTKLEKLVMENAGPRNLLHADQSFMIRGKGRVCDNVIECNGCPPPGDWPCKKRVGGCGFEHMIPTWWCGYIELLSHYKRTGGKSFKDLAGAKWDGSYKEV